VRACVNAIGADSSARRRTKRRQGPDRAHLAGSEFAYRPGRDDPEKSVVTCAASRQWF
jgi:hypothetical protein